MEQINSLRDNGTPYMGIHFINLFIHYWCYNAHSDWWGVNTVIFAVLIAYQVEEWLLLAQHLHLLFARVAPTCVIDELMMMISNNLLFFILTQQIYIHNKTNRIHKISVSLKSTKYKLFQT